MSLRHRFVLSLCALLLAACGGGGGGGGDSGDSELVLGAATPTTLSTTVSNLSFGPGQRQLTLTAPYTGTASGTVYVLVVDPDQALAQPTVQVLTNTVALTLNVAPNLAVGSYTQPVVVHVCKDAACAQPFRGSPQTFQKNIVVTGTRLGASTMNFSSTLGLAPAPQVVSVTPPPGLTYTVEHTGYTEYTNPSGGTALLNIAEVFDVEVQADGLKVQPKGSYAGRFALTLWVEAQGHARETLTVTYEVGAAVGPTLTLLADAPAVQGQSGRDADLPLDVELLASRAISETRVSLEGLPDPVSTGWLQFVSITPFAHGGSATDNARRLSLRFNACRGGGVFYTCLSPGTYRANVVLSTTSFNHVSVVSVPVTFVVN